MSIYIIGDEDTVLGLSLAGIEGQAVHSVEEARTSLDRALEDPDIDIVLVTEDWAAEMRDKVNELIMTVDEPLVAEIPSSEPGPQGPSLQALVEEAVGIPLGLEGSR
jgi:V/A-type H+-transporting ATPase subunit F